MRLKNRKARSTPPKYTPKFQPGQRVRVSEEGIRYQVAKAGTLGTVEHCGLVAQIRIDGAKETISYWPDYWDAIDVKK